MLFAFFWLKVNRDFGPCIFLTNLFAPLISWLADVTFGRYKATPSGITVSGLGHSLLSRRAGGSTHYAIIHHCNLKVT